MADQDVLTLTRRLGRIPNIDTAIDILTWELGDLRKSETYKTWHPSSKIAYQEEQKKALGAIVFQSMVIASLLGVSLDDIIKLGFENAKERIVDLQNKSGRFAGYVGDGITPGNYSAVGTLKELKPE